MAGDQRGERIKLTRRWESLRKKTLEDGFGHSVSKGSFPKNRKVAELASREETKGKRRPKPGMRKWKERRVYYSKG